jgi:GTP-binding protein
MKKIALIGKPNVGKSSLFNRFSRKLDAITSEVSGTTRDVKSSEIFIKEKPCLLIDTGGLDDSNTMFEKVRDKSLQAASEADIVLYMVDGKRIPDDEDKKLFFQLQKISKEIVLLVNKIDNEKQERDIALEFVSFGAKNLFFVSVSHNKGIEKLSTFLASKLPEIKEEVIIEDDDLSFEDFINETPQMQDELGKELRVAIIGRVNVGKSSLLNALVKEERSIVSEIAGTTIDPVDEQIEYKDKLITFVDTAGIRKRGKIDGIERHALQRTQKMLENADVALLVLDSSEEFKELDEKIAHLVDKFQMACMIVLNKFDISKYDYDKSVQLVRDRFVFLSYAPVITVSALSHKRVHKINDQILDIYDSYTKRISTSKLNEVINFAIRKHNIPSAHGRLVRIYFSTQYDIKPPRIALIMNKPKALHFSYKRYLVNQLRDAFDFKGTPIIIEPKAKRVTDDEEKI